MASFHHHASFAQEENHPEGSQPSPAPEIAYIWVPFIQISYTIPYSSDFVRILKDYIINYILILSFKFR